MLTAIIEARVRRRTIPLGPVDAGCRLGTVELSIEEAEVLLGAPSWTSGTPGRYDRVTDESATIGWYFDTPRGVVEVHDYWWNGRRELSIGAPAPIHAGMRGIKAALWLIAYLRRHDITAHLGITKRSKPQ